MGQMGTNRGKSRQSSGRPCLEAAGFVLGEHSRFGRFIRGAVVAEVRFSVAVWGVSIADPR
jgi:hypothetical protein